MHTAERGVPRGGGLQGAAEIFPRGGLLPAIPFPSCCPLYGFLAADANANRVVDKPDQQQIKGQANQPVTGANFRDDVNADGQIKSADANLVKTNKGHSIP